MEETGVLDWSLSCNIFAKWVEVPFFFVCVGAATRLRCSHLAISIECMEDFGSFLLGMSYIRGYVD